MKKILPLILASLLILGCKNTEKAPEVTNVQVDEKVYQWFYFGEGSIKKAEKISDIPVYPFKPWTQVTSISSISSAAFSDGINPPEAYAVVNRSGILEFKGKNFELFSDSRYFKGKTAGNLVFYKDTPVFTTYRSSFFDDKEKADRSVLHTFLVQLDKTQKIFYPILNVENLGFDESSEVTGLLFDGKNWTGEVKTSGEEKITFDYFNLQVKEDLLSITPGNAESSVFVTESSVQKFRNGWEPQSYSKAPERIKKLLKSLPSDFCFSVTVKTCGGAFPRIFEKNISDSAVYATALLGESWSSALFEDGTFYIEGALFGRQLINGGKTAVLRLPVLPEGFKYSGFAISGDYLYASWEEYSINENGRTGFIRLDLGSILYK